MGRRTSQGLVVEALKAPETVVLVAMSAVVGGGLSEKRLAGEAAWGGSGS